MSYYIQVYKTIETPKNVNILNFILTFQLTCSHLQEIKRFYFLKMTTS